MGSATFPLFLREALNANPIHIQEGAGNAMSELQVIARYTAASGEEDEVADLVVQLAAASRTEPGNVDFTAYRQLDDPRRFVLLERYASRAALDAHRDTAHFADLVAGRLIPRLDSRVVETYEVADDQNAARS